MQITGKITNAQPPDYVDPKHGNKYQNIVIEEQNGQCTTGRIGSKNGYQIGASLTVEVTEKQGRDGLWNQFKRIDPQNAQQGAPRGQQADKPDWDAIAQGKVRHGLVCAYISGGKEPNINLVNYWMEFIVTGKAPLPPGQQSDQHTRNDYDYNPQDDNSL